MSPFYGRTVVRLGWRRGLSASNRQALPDLAIVLAAEQSGVPKYMDTR
jgi:hypothetical protein